MDSPKPRVAVIDGGANRLSILEKLARKIEPKDDELKAAGKLPPFSRRARLLPTGASQKNLKLSEAEGPRVAQPSAVGVKMHDGRPMVFFNDGSLRHLGGKVKGKAKRKALKRLKQHIRGLIK